MSRAKKHTSEVFIAKLRAKQLEEWSSDGLSRILSSVQPGITGQADLYSIICDLGLHRNEIRAEPPVNLRGDSTRNLN
jgi:hypothetical protein